MAPLCAGCGYPKSTHDLGTLKCHPATANKKGTRGTWRDPIPPGRALWREIIARDSRARQAAIDDARRVYVPPVVLPPQVPARPPRGPHELAGYQGKQAVGLGRRAVAQGYAVAAYYWRAGDGSEGCALRLASPGSVPTFAVATWARKAGNVGKTSGWSADIAYAWRERAMPVKLTHTELDGVFDT